VRCMRLSGTSAGSRRWPAAREPLHKPCRRMLNRGAHPPVRTRPRACAEVP
jgi:hypothetical protein